MQRNSKHRHSWIAAMLVTALAAPVASAAPARGFEGFWGSAWEWVVSLWGKAGWCRDPWGEPSPTGTEDGTNAGWCGDPWGKAGWTRDPDGSPGAPAGWDRDPDGNAGWGADPWGKAGWCRDPDGIPCVPPSAGGNGDPNARPDGY
jgi:hypothetical protein